MDKPRLLIPISLQFSIRYLLRSGLLEKIHNVIKPIILIAWEDHQLWNEFKALGADVYLMPTTFYGPKYIEARNKITSYHFLRSDSATVAIDRRRRDINKPVRKKVRDSLRRLVAGLEALHPATVAHMIQQEANLVESETNLHVFSQLIRQLRPQAVFSLTPFSYYGQDRQEELLLRSAKKIGLPMCTAILSFDNLTTRGWISVLFDQYFLWNRHNQQELLRLYPSVHPNQIIITGTPQFDFYYNPEYIWNHDDWRQKLGLPFSRPVILFGAGPKSISPIEPHFLHQIDQAIENNELPGKPVVLFRRHPVDDDDRWAEVRQATRHVVYDNSWEESSSPFYFNIRRQDLENLTSTLFHSSVHVSTSSTMTVDGAIFDRPQVAPAYDDTNGKRYDRIYKELYLREHYFPITRSDGLALAYSRDQLIQAIREGFENPGARAQGRKKLLEQIITFLDGKGTERISRALLSFLHIV